MSARRRWGTAVQVPPHERILSFLRDNGSTWTSAATVAVLTGESTSQARHRLEALVRRGTVVRRNTNGWVSYRAATQHEPQGVDHDAASR